MTLEEVRLLLAVRREDFVRIKGRKRRSGAAVGDQPGGIVVRTDQLAERVGVQRQHREREPGDRRARNPHAARIGEGPARWLDREAGVGDGEHRGGPGSGERLFAVIGAGQTGAAGVVADHHLALHIAEHFGAAIAAIGDRAVERCGNAGRRRGDIVEEPQPLAVNEQIGAHDIGPLHRDRLEPCAVGAEGFYPGLGKTVGDAFRRAVIAGRAGVAALHLVAGEFGGDRPPCLGVGVDSSGGGLGEGQGDEGEHGGVLGVCAGGAKVGETAGRDAIGPRSAGILAPHASGAATDALRRHLPLAVPASSLASVANDVSESSRKTICLNSASARPSRVR